MEHNYINESGGVSLEYVGKKGSGNFQKKMPYETLGNKVPPHSIDAEQAVLGAMMTDNSIIPRSIELLHVDNFYTEKHKHLFSAIVNLFSRGIEVDLITLSNELSKIGKLENVDGTFYLSELMSNFPTSVNFENHVKIILEKHIKRSLILAAGKMLANGYDDSKDALEEIDNAQQDIFQIAEKRFSSSFKEIKRLAHDTMEIIQELKATKNPGITGVPSGFRELDDRTGGFQNSDLIIIAGRPSMGKTALALSMARNAAIDHNIPVGIFSLEMSNTQLVMRLVSAEARVNAQKIRTGMISSQDYDKIALKIGKLADSKMFIDDSPVLSLIELKAKCRRLKAEHGIRLIIIDYLQLMHPPKAESREREISIISRSLKQVAKELDIPMVALAQLNRGVESRADKRPMLSDLRESGSIEQDADVVLFIYRPEEYGIMTYDDDKQDTKGTAEIIIGKQRNGPIGRARLAYIRDFARFENLARNMEEPPDNIVAYDDFDEEEPF